ncbi:MAG: hypothetical protein QW040_03820 [Candidatus Aenigmatarchaeota archaeon]
MPSWIVEDSILAPRDKIEINYKGPNPFQLYKKMDSNFFQSRFEIGGTDFMERDFRWSADSDPHPFFIRLFIHKDYDKYTEAWFEILFQGVQPSDPTKEGNVKITIGGNLRTKFELETGFQQTPFYRGLLWFYIKFFYANLRRKYLKDAQRRIEELVREIREWAGMPEVVYV